MADSARFRAPRECNGGGNQDTGLVVQMLARVVKDVAAAEDSQKIDFVSGMGANS